MRNIEFQNIELTQNRFSCNTTQEKDTPNRRPLYDALYDMLDFEKARAYIEQEIIEIAPIAFMRGRILNNAFIILDEAQNTPAEQMKLFLTQLGYGSKAIVTFTKEDVVRHSLVSNIIDAYEKNKN